MLARCNRPLSMTAIERAANKKLGVMQNQSFISPLQCFVLYSSGLKCDSTDFPFQTPNSLKKIEGKKAQIQLYLQVGL